MTRPEAGRRTARGGSRAATLVAGAGALVVAACTLVMLVDHAVAARRAPHEAARIKELEERVRTDAAAAETLGAERERQTAASLARKKRNRALAWTLLVAGAVTVAAAKWSRREEPPAIPALDRLVADRFPAADRGVRGGPRDDGGNGEISEEAFVDDLVTRFGRGREAVIPMLQAIQMRYRHLPDRALARICERTEISPAQLAGTSTFYAQFRRSPVGRHVVRVCHGTACHVAGAATITDELRRHLDVPDDADTDPRRLFTIETVACVGCCSLAPVLMVGEETAGRLSPATARNVVDALEPDRERATRHATEAER